MSTPLAGTTNKGIFSRNDYLAPLPIPTGRKPCDVLNTIWRKNDVFIDIGNYSIGLAVMVMWLGSISYESGAAEETMGSTWVGLGTGSDKPA